MDTKAATVIRDARERSGMSQAELARSAGVAQPVVSAYESARREPGLRMLTKLVEATGQELSVKVVETPHTRRGLPNTPLGRRMRRRRRAIIRCAAHRGASNVRVFGSVARGEDTETSDVDLLVDLADGVGLISLSALGRELGELLGRTVDVAPASTLKPGVRDEVFAEAISL